jgi:L-fuculose-phosphate aldolase
MNLKYWVCIVFVGAQTCGNQACTASKDETIAIIDDLVEQHSILQHPFLKHFQSVKYADMNSATQDFATEHYVYSRNFQVYLKNVLRKIDDEESIKLIGANIKEESGHYDEDDLEFMEKHDIGRESYNGIAHPKLMKRFVKAAKANENFEGGAAGKFTDLMIDTTANSDVCVGLAILAFAIESTVSRLYSFIWDGLKMSKVLKKSDYVFFPLHILIDDGHADALKTAWWRYYQKSPNTCLESSYKATKMILDARVQWYDTLHARYSSKQTTKESEIAEAKRRTMELSDPGYNLQQKLALTARILAWQGQGNTLSGQITCRDHLPDGRLALWVQKYGLGVEELTPSDFIHVDEDLKPIDPNETAFPNYATRFHVHVYRKRPDIQCMVHSHPIHVSALAMTGQKLQPEHMDFMAFYEEVQHLEEWPGVPFGDLEGEIISSLLGEEHWSGLLANHGLIVAGKNIEEATYRAYFFERAAKAQLLAMAASPSLRPVKKELGNQARDWRMAKGPVLAHYRYWSRMVLRNAQTEKELFPNN